MKGVVHFEIQLTLWMFNEVNKKLKKSYKTHIKKIYVDSNVIKQICY